MIESAFNEVVPKDLINPELLKDEVVRVVLFVLCRLPELVSELLAEIVKLPELKISPELTRFALVKLKLVAEETSP
jgi:hypothetical protein